MIKQLLPIYFVLLLFTNIQYTKSDNLEDFLNPQNFEDLFNEDNLNDLLNKDIDDLLNPEKNQQDLANLQNQLIKKFVNILFKQVQTELNTQLPNMVQTLGLDPLEKVAEGSGSKQMKVSNFCNANTVYTYQLENLKGISSLHITDLSILELQDMDSQNNMVVKSNIQMEFQQNLTLDINGTAHAKCSYMEWKPTLKGKGILNNVKGSSPVTLVVNLNDVTDPKLKSLTIDNLKIDYESLDIQFENLGALENLIKPIIKDVEDEIHDDVVDIISVSLQTVLQTVIDAMML